MIDCIFCQIVAKKIPAKIISENSEVVAFRDISPQAPFHALIIPKKHIATLNDLSDADTMLVGQVYLEARRIVEREGIAQKGYRTVMNCNSDAGQTVFHIHLHVLGGRKLGWPPG